MLDLAAHFILEVLCVKDSLNAEKTRLKQKIKIDNLCCSVVEIIC
jgi:hypothetical protein